MAWLGQEVCFGEIKEVSELCSAGSEPSGDLVRGCGRGCWKPEEQLSSLGGQE